MVRTQIQLTEAQSAILKRLAEERNKSVAQLIRESIDALVRSEGLVDMQQRKEKALAACGQFAFGPSAARRHDDYLADAYGEIE